MSRIRVLVVDDVVTVRRMVTAALSTDDEIEVVGTAPNGRIALAKLDQINPDLVTLDVEMPELNGIETLRELRRVRPDLPVIMCSTLTERGGAATLDALALGANDYVTKPSGHASANRAMEWLRGELVPKVKSLTSRRRLAPVARIASSSPAAAAPVVPRQRAAATGRVEVIAIGISTGGPNALAAMLPMLPADIGVPIVIVQHMPALFTRLLAERLDRSCAIAVREAERGMVLQPGVAYVAPGDWHLVLARDPSGAISTQVHRGPPENSCRPAADVLFRSVVEQFGGNVLGVVMTGMGQDGMRGCEAISHAGGHVIVQDEATSVVWGMPGFVVQHGLADQVLPLDQIAGAIVRRVRLAPTGAA